MACEVCEHCQTLTTRRDCVSICGGYSYHMKCHKCYVCSETNLHNAEVFKGVIFCSSCSQRIFQGCSDVRRSKCMPKTKRTRSRSHRRSRAKAQDRRSEKARVTKGVIELARLAASTDSDSIPQDLKDSKLSELAMSAMITLPTERPNSAVNLKKESIEMGTTTEVTQELLVMLECPIVTGNRNELESLVKRLSKIPRYENPNSKIICSDLRIAELGASTEIANMALRNKSELPVILQSETRLKRLESITVSMLNPESDVSGDGKEFLDSAYSSLRDSEKSNWMDRRLRSIIKIPYRNFKKHILNRSSLISVLMDSEKDRFSIVKPIKSLFRDEGADHQRCGVRRLYSTINRRKTPYKMGWLNLMRKDSGVVQCKHVDASHSYRCMRRRVMRSAGPTRSELKLLRKKLGRVIAPSFIKHLTAYNKNYAAVMMTQGCGNDYDGRVSKKTSPGTSSCRAVEKTEEQL